MLSGRARNGPLDGVLIHAGRTWDGRVRQDSNGRYVWFPQSTRWIWHRDREPVAVMSRGRRR